MPEVGTQKSPCRFLGLPRQETRRRRVRNVATAQQDGSRKHQHRQDASQSNRDPTPSIGETTARVT